MQVNASMQVAFVKEIRHTGSRQVSYPGSGEVCHPAPVNCGGVVGYDLRPRTDI